MLWSCFAYKVKHVPIIVDKWKAIRTGSDKMGDLLTILHQKRVLQSDSSQGLLFCDALVEILKLLGIHDVVDSVFTQTTNPE